jgi:hypothetical protein
VKSAAAELTALKKRGRGDAAEATEHARTTARLARSVLSISYLDSE